MTKMNDFRSVNEFEKSLIVNGLSKISQKSDAFIMKIQNRLYISFNTTSSKSQNPSIYLISTDHHDLIEKLLVDFQITSVGLYFGFIEKDNFRLSLEGAEFLVNNEDFFKGKMLVINNKGEKSILYGNDIKMEEVLKFPTNLRKGDILVIYNSQNELCAITRSLVGKKDLTRLNSGDKIALNLVDKGYYLRKKQ